MKFRNIVLEWKRSLRLAMAIKKINQTNSAHVNERFLNLSSLGLDSQDLETLMPQILEIGNLQKLNLKGNKLTVLPDDLKVLSDLKTLNLKNNRLETLPDSLGELKELETLNLKNNQLQKLSDSLGKLKKLKELNLSNNRLIKLPASVCTLPDERLKIKIKNNDRLNPDDLWKLQERFTELSTENKKTRKEILLYRIYRVDGAKVLEQIKDLKLGHFQIKKDRGWFRIKNKKKDNTSKILLEFLNKIPPYGTYNGAVYIPAVKSLLDTIMDEGTSITERQTALQKIATSLGDCGTPVKSFLTQVFVGLHRDSEGNISEITNSMISAMAIEEAIIKAFKFGAKKKEHQKKEHIEIVQALRNSLFLEGAEDHHENSVPIKGTRPRLPSLTRTIDYGYRLVKLEQAKQFAKMCCQEKSTGDCVMEGGK